ncbi:nuclear speckle splicing regulatory protein 1-like [Physella acuta]|uniref:nuclear speckle splicing regulatory protein 1-like n=1 Tax=Physella acuta TaxID=109671 RepID=UPI0027DCE190|nr:nuclear speckle splicing regulatory protein 1-like [Physella acuta]
MADDQKSGKVYGLILPKKAGQSNAKSGKAATFNVFGGESDEEDNGSTVKTSAPKTVKRQTQMDIDKALQEDPTVYEYDSIYDDLQAKKPQVGAKEKSSVDRKPKYIAGLLKAAETKKKEDERRKERQVQKEREAEGEMFADKEKFVTSAYKQKLLELQAAEEEEKRQAAIESMLDVTKQKDMSGFYRYLYRSTAGNDITPSGDGEKMEIKEEEPDAPDNNVKKEETSPPKHKESSSSSAGSSSDSDGSDSEVKQGKEKIAFSKPIRPNSGGKFRKRKSDSSSPESNRDRSKGSSYRRQSSPHRRRSSDDRRQSSPHRRRSFDNKRQSSPHRRRSSDDKRQSSPHRRSSPPYGRQSSSQRGYSPGARGRRRDDDRDSYRSRGSRNRHSRSRSPRSRSPRARSPARVGRRAERSRSRSLPRNSEAKHRQRSRSRSKDRSAPDEPHQKHKAGSHRERSGSSDRKMRNSPPGGRKDEPVGLDGKVGGGDKPREEGSDEEVSEGPLREDSVKVAADRKDDVKVAVEDKKQEEKPVDPKDKVYPHHNSQKDIAEARKRYLLRKIARESERAA